MKTPSERYETDANYKACVDMLEHFIHRNFFTPSELREAAIIASIHYETKRLPDLIMFPRTQKALRDLEIIRQEEGV